MKKLLLSFVAALSLSITGCSSPATTTTKELEDFNIVLDWYPNAVHSFIYEAIDRGYYEEEGLNVQIQFPSNSNDALSLTAAGKADAGIYYLHNVIDARANQGIPVVSLGAICQDPLNIFLSLKEENITKPEDLIGKKIGISGSALGEAMIQYIFDEMGASNEQMDVIDVGFELMSSMTTGNVDVTWGCMVNHEVPQMEAEGFEVNYFTSTECGIPNYYELILVTGEKQVEEDSEKLEKFIRASQKGFEHMKEDPEASVDLLLKHQNEENFPLDKSVEMQSIATLLPTMEKETGDFLSQDAAVWNENIKWMYEIGIIAELFDADEVLVDFSN